MLPTFVFVSLPYFFLLAVFPYVSFYIGRETQKQGAPTAPKSGSRGSRGTLFLRFPSLWVVRGLMALILYIRFQSLDGFLGEVGGEDELLVGRDGSIVGRDGSTDHFLGEVPSILSL